LTGCQRCDRLVRKALPWYPGVLPVLVKRRVTMTVEVLPKPAAPTSAELAAAELLLARMGLTADNLRPASANRSAAPTFAEYVPVVAASVSAGSLRAYGSYWNRLVSEWGDRRLDEPTASEIRQFTERIKTGVVLRRNARGGRGAVENFVAALRCVYRHAEDDRLIREADNPARRVAKPRRLESTRRAVADDRLAEINHIAVTTGNDPVLDALLLRLHTETACRRGGALALRPRDLDERECLVLLREKGETVRWQPVSPTLMTHLVAHARHRGALGEARLLRYANGRPITTRRYDHLWDRIGRHLPWVATQQITTHWLRHTTLTWVERNFGYPIARAFAGHTDTHGPGAISTYVKATLSDVAAAVTALTGEPHPLARGSREPRSSAE
jgi:integrase/recombinase XerC